MDIHARIEAILAERKRKGEFRSLSTEKLPIDFTSNDYLGLSKSTRVIDQLNQKKQPSIGSTGSRLLSGNSAYIEKVEQQIADFHNAQSALLFSTGFDANLGVISTLCRKNDVVLYDELVHASIHTGIKLSEAEALPFKHNDVIDLEVLLEKQKGKNVFIIIESLYSMDGDKAPLKAIANLQSQYHFECIIDEAHALGVFGNGGRGLCEQEGVEQQMLARIYTFGKAMGAHGAVVVGPQFLKDYLVNFCKPTIYSTAPSHHFVATVEHCYEELLKADNQRFILFELINYFNLMFRRLSSIELIGEGPVFGIRFNDVSRTRSAAEKLRNDGFDVRPIVYPTVARGSERIRICLHAYNTKSEIDRLFEAVKNFLNDEK